MSLFNILACPNCKVSIIHEPDSLFCQLCNTRFPIINNIPIMFPDGSLPEIKHESELLVRDTYDPWVHRVILQSLLDNQIVIDIGSGNMTLDDPCIIRMDVMLNPYVDLVADAHHLPFLPESVDYIFSLAVFEHLRNPFQAANSIYETLKDGGYIYHECNFVFAYHGYPHHYFNATLQGLEQIFSAFVTLREGIAPYQMPSFALDMLIRTYLRYTHAREYKHGKHIANLLNTILNEDLTQYDIYFSEEEALNVAAGTFFAGIKQDSPDSTTVPEIILEIWKQNKELQYRFPNVNQLTTSNNILAWAKQEGKDHYKKIAEYLVSINQFNKRGSQSPWHRSEIHNMPFVEPKFVAINFDPEAPMAENARIADLRRKNANQ